MLNLQINYCFANYILCKSEGGYSVSYHFQQYFSYIVVVNFIGGGNRSIRGKPPAARKSLTNFSTKCYIEYTSPEWDSNSQR